jgi:hypothetical protein
MKIETGCNSNMADVSDHELCRIKIKGDHVTDLLDKKNPTSDTMARQSTIGIDTKSPVLYIKSEPQDDSTIHCYPQNTSEYSQSEAEKSILVQTVTYGAGAMYMVNHDNQ